VVKNVGPGPVPDSVWTVDTLESTGVHLYTNGSWWSWDSIQRFDSAKNLKSPGGTATCVSTLQVSGAAIIKAVVDRRNVVPEANEDNNSLETKLSCGS
jgi:subtilase family serine protease